MTNLDKMWDELAKYQPYAKRRGFGKTWQRMCKKRNKDKAAAGTAFAVYAVLSTTTTEPEWPKHVIEYIRKAIEQEEENSNG